MPSEEGINIGSPCGSPTDYNRTLTLRPNGPGGNPDTVSDGKEGINIGSLMDHQLTHHTQTSRNWNTTVQAVQYRNTMLCTEKLENSGDSEN